jgi:uncharacterized protein
MSEERVTGITVIGTGEVAAPPDVMTVEIGVSVRADTVASASTSAREGATRLIETLTGLGVARDDIATTTYAVHPEYDHHEGAQRLLGYRVSNDLRVRLRDVTRAGETIDAGVGAVGDMATVNQIVFSIDDAKDANDRARVAAWGDAVAKAEHLASLAGRPLGPVVAIVETSGRLPGPRPLARMAMAEASPIEPGTTGVTVTLEVRFPFE